MNRPSRIMVVDDASDNRTIFNRMLRRRGFEVVEAEGGLQAIEMLKEQPIDLMLLDVMMPDLSGLDVLCRIRQSRSEVDLPIIMISAANDGEKIVKSLNLGANDYISKPFDMSVMLARLHAQLARKQGAEQYRQERLRVIEYAAKLREQSEALLRSLQDLTQEVYPRGHLEDTSRGSAQADSYAKDGEQDTQRRGRRTFKAAKIVLNGRKSVIDCIVWESFEGGALLRVESESGVPDEFELAVDNKPPVNCYVVQRSLNELLVQFLQ